MGIYTTILICLFFSFTTDAYVRSRTNLGSQIYWDRDYVDINFQTQNSYGFSDGEIRSIVSGVLGEWNQNSSFKVYYFENDEKPLITNTVYFSNNSEFFGSAVLAVTQLAYDENTGVIQSADIIINDNMLSNPITSSASEKNYLGDIVAHELGHVFGLGHGEVKNSSMFFSWIKGQHHLSEDDKSGVASVYPKASLNTISGKVVGGKELTGILGAHVQLISASTGEVKASSFSNDNGSFEIKGVDTSEVYYLYVSPRKNLTTLPIYYQESKTDFCYEKKSYRGGFFQRCDSREIGHPQEVVISKPGSVDVGNVTIRCDIDSPPSYFISKAADEDFSLDLSSGINSFVGSFSKTELSGGKKDRVEVDLSHYTVPSSDYYLEVRVIYQKLYSPLKLDLALTSGQTLDLSSTSQLDSDGNPNLDIIGRIRLDTASGANIFNLELTPTDFDTFLISSSYNKEDYFPSYSLFLDTQAFYLLMARIVKKEADGTYSLAELPTNLLVEDNTRCPDAPNTYSVKGDTGDYFSDFTFESTSRDGFISCGTVSLDNDDHTGGGGSFLLGLVFCLGLSSFFRLTSRVLSLKS